MSLADESEDQDFVPAEHEDDDEIRSRNFQSYPQTVETSLRYGLSNRVTSSMMNSMITDLKMPAKHNLVSIEKVRMMKIRHGFKLHAIHEDTTGYKYIGFDGSKSMAIQAKNKWKVKDKNTIICQARRAYIDHFIPLSGQGVALANGVIEVIYKCGLMHVLKHHIAPLFKPTMCNHSDYRS